MTTLRPARTLSLLALVGVLLAACSSSIGTLTTLPPASPAASSESPVTKAPFIPQLISAETIMGPNRYLFGVLDATGQTSIAAPDLKLTVAFQADGASPTEIPAAPATFIWAIPDERGVYALPVTFPSAGNWTALFKANGGGLPDATVAVQFEVKAKGLAIPIGGKAYPSQTPTAATADDIAKIATDPKPDPSFYTTSVARAIAEHRPFVLVFATPAFCTSKQCGPTLDGIKAVARDEQGIVFINVEPYRLSYADGRLQPVLDAANQLQPVDAVREWGILSEPWVFVVDGKGIVRGSFETVVSAEELKAAIAAARG